MKSASIGVFILSLAAFSIFQAPQSLHAQSSGLTPAQKAQLEQELAQVEAEQRQAEAELKSAQAKSSSLARDIAVLNAKIKTAQLNIKAKTLLIQTLGNDIAVKQRHITNLEAHIDKGKETLADILRKTNEFSSYSMPEVILSQTTISGFFKDIDTFDSVQQSLATVFEELRADKASTTEEKIALDNRRSAELDARYAIQQEEKNIKADEAEKQQLLAVSKGNEKSYSSVIAQKQARAAQIRAALFALRDAAAIPFGQALQYAQAASAKTGIRPAFLLAIITQESNLGANVGACYLTDPATGAGVGANTGTPKIRVMSPTRDVPIFLDIIGKLGGSPYKSRVSCWITDYNSAGSPIGWGGAMGPAQFIPSTWVLFQDRISRALGLSGIADPWNPMHAFMASALYLSDLGASAGTYSAERNAACKYYSGRACGLASGNSAYGNQVVAQADTIQRTMIDPLQGL